MKIYDISQGVFNAEVYPGDPIPEKEEVLRISRGDKCNLTSIRMCCHNATHVDAPYHFLDGGKTIGEISLDKFIGRCRVVDMQKDCGMEQLTRILQDGVKKIILKGDFLMSVEAAKEMADKGIDLIGVEGCTVGNEETGSMIHQILLKKEIVILEGLMLGQVKEGEYFLAAQPINFGETDGAPCRAVLMEGI